MDTLGADEERSASRGAILGKINRFCKGSREGDVLFICFSGHGLHYEGNDYLVPYDADVSDPDIEDYLVSVDLSKKFEDSAAGTILFFIDACREGIELGTKSLLTLRPWSEGKLNLSKERSIAFIFSCEKGEVSRFVEGEQGFSLFSRSFAETLRSELALKSFKSLITSLQKRLDELADEHGKDRQKIRVRTEVGLNHFFLDEHTTEQQHTETTIAPPKENQTVAEQDFLYDIAISYAHVDDAPMFGEKDGWVTTLIKNVKVQLAQRLGGEDAFSIWSDHQLPGNIPISEMLEIFRQSATLIVVLSPGFIRSEWCQQQKSHFLDMLQEQVHSRTRIFVIERDELEAEERPPEFYDLRGYQFWIKEREGKPPHALNPQHDAALYHERLNELSYDLAKEIRKERQKPDSEKTKDSHSAMNTTQTKSRMDAIKLRRLRDKREELQQQYDLLSENIRAYNDDYHNETQESRKTPIKRKREKEYAEREEVERKIQDVEAEIDLLCNGTDNIE